MSDRKGEIVTGVMVVIMAVMMVVMMFGGMHMMHGDHKSEGDNARIEKKHQHDEETRPAPDGGKEQTTAPGKTEGK
jgi:hypothetical protein